MANRFGGEWTNEKLVAVKRYLDSYVNVMKNQFHFTTHYIDAFAGTGYVKLKQIEKSDTDQLDEASEASQSLLAGSARQSLDVTPAFDHYHFFEQKPSHARELLRLQTDFPDRAIHIVNGDANDLLPALCRSWKQNDRGVLFLDPFGVSVDWETLKIVAETKAIDVWYLVSVFGINRMMTRKDLPNEAWTEVLNRTFGTNQWRDVFYRSPRQPTLFEPVEDQIEKRFDWEKLFGFVLDRLKSIFPGVAPHPLVLKNSIGSPLFLLCFAMGNPGPKPQAAALGIANHILGMDP